MRATPYNAPSGTKVEGSWLTRSFRTVFYERKAPYRVGKLFDRFCKSIGYCHKIVSFNGLKIKVRRLTTDEFFFQNIIINEGYNPVGYEIKKKDTVIDIGGNIGTFAVLAGRHASEGLVVCLEPAQDNYRLLLMNIALNGLKNVVTKKVALVDKRKKVKLHLNDKNTGCHSVFESYGSDPAKSFEIVDGVTLADVFDEHAINQCDFLKVDCEGAEYQILYSLPKEYFDRIQKIVMEYHTTSDIDRVDKQADELVNYLQHLGYTIDSYLTFGGGGFIRARRSR